MTGTWTITRRSPISIHTFTAPGEGWLANSHIVEFPLQLFVVDAQYTLPFAGEVVSYGAKLNKPLTRLYVTHYHPDHLLGATAFKAPLYTLSSVADKVAAVGDRVSCSLSPLERRDGGCFGNRLAGRANDYRPGSCLQSRPSFLW